MIMSEKVMKWRSQPLHRKCIFCKYLKFNTVNVFMPVRDYYTCSAKNKYISDCVPDMTRWPRPFCRLFELDTEKKI